MEVNTIILGHAKTELPNLPKESVNCIITSPPYWGLRDYGIEPVIWDGDKDCKHDFSIETKAGDIRFRAGKNTTVGNCKKSEIWEGDGKGNFCSKCNAWRGSLGLEPTFELYIKHLCDIFDEVKRVLRKDGTCWVNLGDSYNGTKVGNTNASTGAIGKPKYSGDFTKTFKKENQNNIPTKSLCLIPQRFVIEMVNRGWIARNVLIWHKTNCMPSSAKDRFTVDFENVFFFTKSNKALFWTNEKTLECVSKQPPGTKGIEGKDWEWSNNKKVSLWTGHDYWFEQQFEKHTSGTHARGGKKIGINNDFKQSSQACKKGGWNELPPITNPQGRNKRAVWTIPTSPFPEAHFAVYPEKLIEPMITAGCPRYVCKKCGKAREKIYKSNWRETKQEFKGITKHSQHKESPARRRDTNLYARLGDSKKEFLGYTDCGCNAGFEPGVTLDPFIGAGTTAVVAKKLGRNYKGIEIKQEYIDMANKRIRKIPELLF